MERKKMSRVAYQNKKRKRKKLKPWVSWAFCLFFLVVLLYASTTLFHWQSDNKKINTIVKDIDKVVETKEKESEGELINPPDNKDNDYWNYIKVPFLEVNFTSLLQKNKDTVAFIHMENTNINYPIVQAIDNDFYLNHAFDKSKNDAGWVYMDYRNNIDSLSDNTIIYGHGRVDTTVFGSLKNVLTKKWQQDKNNYIIRLSTPKENMVFQIFSVYTIEAESYYITSTFYSEKTKQEWLDTMKKRNVAPIETAVNTSDKILTLSTCQNNKGGRIVVQAKLIKKETR